MAATSAQVGSRRPAAADERRPVRALRGRVIAAALRLASAILGRLPDGPLHRLAHATGGLLYRVQPSRRRLVAGNLRRVCSYLADQGLVEPGSAAWRASRDERSLQRLVRSAFGHYLRGYLETAIVGSYAERGRAPTIEPDEPSLVEEAFGRPGEPPRPLIVIGMHFGAIEVPGVWASRHGLRVTAPMETIADPHLQAYLVRSRSASGLKIVPAEQASRELTAALARDEVVALVADRVVSGAGARVELFGGLARLPIGPAALALRSGAAAWLVTSRRVGWTGYRVRLERIALPGGHERRERLSAFLESEARAFERAVATAPEQWWTLFFPIWPEDSR